MAPPLPGSAVAPVSRARLTTTEVCQLARLSRASVWRRIAAGRLPAPIDHGRQALFCAEAITRALSRPAVEPAARDAVFAARFDHLIARRNERDLISKNIQNKTTLNSEIRSEIRSTEAGLGPDRRNS